MNPFCRRFGMRVPLIQAPFGGNTTPELAIAVSNAGGLGGLGLTGRGEEYTRKALPKVMKETGGRVICNLLLPYDIETELNAALDLGAPLISLFWGDPTLHIGRIHKAGARVIVTVGSVDEAKRAADSGADAIVAQGGEAGGHVRGTVSTLVLVPQVIDVVGELPVVAAGGIADGRGLAAVMALGAQAGWAGTAFVVAEEANAHSWYRDRVVSARTEDTHYSKLYDVGWRDAPGRSIRNSTVEGWEAAGHPASGKRPGEGEVIATGPGEKIERYSPVAVRRELEGNIEGLSLWAGQSVGLVNRRRPAAEIVEDFDVGYRKALSSVSA